MTAVIWPFKPLQEVIEELQFATDIIQAKSAEQRISLRTAPRRTFQLSHLFNDYEYSHARSLIRDAQGGDGFLVPDWPQSINVGSVSPGSDVPVPADLSYTDIGDTALLWESNSKFEAVSLTTDSSGTVMDDVDGTYTSARFIPLWSGYAPESLSVSRAAGRLHQASIAMEIYQNNDLSAAPAGDTYRGLDVLDECPVVGGGELDESIAWAVSALGSISTIPKYIRQRSMPDMISAMRWQVISNADKYALRQWLHYRRGRQKAFWMSSRGKDLEPAANISGTTITVFAFPGLSGLGRDDEFDIEVKTSTNTYRRRVTGLVTGTPTAGRDTIDMTINNSLSASLSGIERISYLRCTRLDSDRVELLHQAGAGMSVSVPLIEVPVP